MDHDVHVGYFLLAFAYPRDSRKPAGTTTPRWGPTGSLRGADDPFSPNPRDAPGVSMGQIAPNTRIFRQKTLKIAFFHPKFTHALLFVTQNSQKSQKSDHLRVSHGHGPRLHPTSTPAPSHTHPATTPSGPRPHFKRPTLCPTRSLPLVVCPRDFFSPKKRYPNFPLMSLRRPHLYPILPTATPTAAHLDP